MWPEFKICGLTGWCCNMQQYSKGVLKNIFSSVIRKCTEKYVGTLYSYQIYKLLAAPRKSRQVFFNKISFGSFLILRFDTFLMHQWKSALWLKTLAQSFQSCGKFSENIFGKLSFPRTGSCWPVTYRRCFLEKFSGIPSLKNSSSDKESDKMPLLEFFLFSCVEAPLFINKLD